MDNLLSILNFSKQIGYRSKWKPRILIYSMYLAIIQYCAGEKIEKNEMDGACSAFGVGERRVQGFGGETWGKETTG